SPLAGLPQRALSQLRGTANGIEASARETWAATGAELAADSRVWGAGFARRSATTWESIRRGLGTIPDRAASGEKGGAAAEENTR
ncbi:MAG TPA: hypothetical protein VJS92_14645, partial [Candidatus Polarisedimenticolaceae bacterium]|nr:hypothetical protein [Candidatus Polarisedimenticolaceae bacterium]